MKRMDEMKKLILLSASLLLCLGMQAQNARVYVGTTAPRGSYKNYASPGWNLGAKVDFQVKQHLCLVTSLDMFYNKLTPYANDMALSSQTTPAGATHWGVGGITAPVCINVPLMVHAKFTTRLSERKNKKGDDLDFWGEGAIGLNRRTISQCSYSWTTSDAMGFTENYNVTMSYDAKTTFANQWGVGLTWRNRISVGLVWYNLGRSKLTGSTTITRLTSGESLTSDFNGDPMREKLRTFRIGIAF